jgi:hypothetical protein
MRSGSFAPNIRHAKSFKNLLKAVVDWSRQGALAS